eukprot:6922914-Ditylum_brightwellii.AAC.2
MSVKSAVTLACGQADACATQKHLMCTSIGTANCGMAGGSLQHMPSMHLLTRRMYFSSSL